MPGRIPLLFEELPPLRGDAEDARQHLSRLERLLAAAPLDGIVVPEVLPGIDTPARREREETGAYAAELQQRYGIPVIPYRVVSHPDRTLPDNRDWLSRTRDRGINAVVLVGGAFDGVRYPCGVTDINPLAKAQGYRVGNIIIPFRPDEAGRVTAKAATGADFFTSQVLFESETTAALLQELPALKSRPAFFFSVAPLARQEHLAAALELRCNIPGDLYSRLASANGALARISVDAAAQNLQRIAAYARNAPIDWGIIVSDLGRKSNHGPALQLLRSCRAICESYAR